MRSLLPRSIALCLGFLLFGLLAVGPVRGQGTLTWRPGGGGTGTGTWDTTTANWFNGTSNVPWTEGSIARFNDPAGTVSIFGSVTASQVNLGTPGYTVQNFFLSGASGGLTVRTDADATISSSIFGAAPYNTPFTKTGGGVLSLPGQGPVFFGSATVAAGEMRFTGTGSPDFSTPYILANASGVTLSFSSSQNNIASLGGGGSNGGVVQPNAATGTVALNISGSSDASFGGVLQNANNASLALQKSGTGTQTLTGANTYAGATTVSGGRLVLAGTNGSALASSSVTINAGGTLLLDNSGGPILNSNRERLASNLPITLAGGTLAMTGSTLDNTKQGFTDLNFSRAATVSVTPVGTTDTKLVILGALTRQNNGTISFSNGGVTLNNQNNLNGIVGAYATVGADWASVDAQRAVIAYTGYVTDLAAAGGQSNVRITSAGATTSLAAKSTLNTLNLVNTGSAPAVLDLGTGHQLDLTAGGVLSSGAAGHVIQNGSLTSSGGEIIVTNQSALTVSATITNLTGPSTVTDSLTKSGVGTLVLTGTNSYAGSTVINQGIVQVAADANLGVGKVIGLNGGTLRAAGSFVSSSKSFQGSGGTVDTAGNDVAFYGGSNTGTVTKNGSGKLTLSGTVGTVNVNAGALSLEKLITNNTTTINLYGGRLDATGTVQNVYSAGLSGSSEISPGGLRQAGTLTLGYLTLITPTVVDMDLGSGTTDLLSVSFRLTLAAGSGNPTLLFRFSDLGGTKIGTSYALLQLPSSQLGSLPDLSAYGIDASSNAAGYRGAFSMSNGTLSVTFTTVPEPGVSVLLLVGGALVAWAGWRRTRARQQAV